MSHQSVSLLHSLCCPLSFVIWKPHHFSVIYLFVCVIILVPDYRSRLYFAVSTLTSYFVDVNPQEARECCTHSTTGKIYLKISFKYQNILYLPLNFQNFVYIEWLMRLRMLKNPPVRLEICKLPWDTEWKQQQSSVSPPHFLSASFPTALKLALTVAVSPHLTFLFLCSFSFLYPSFHSVCLSHPDHSTNCGNLSTKNWSQ